MAYDLTIEQLQDIQRIYDKLKLVEVKAELKILGQLETKNNNFFNCCKCKKSKITAIEEISYIPIEKIDTAFNELKIPLNREEKIRYFKCFDLKNKLKLNDLVRITAEKYKELEARTYMADAFRTFALKGLNKIEKGTIKSILMESNMSDQTRKKEILETIEKFEYKKENGSHFFYSDDYLLNDNLDLFKLPTDEENIEIN